MRNTKPHLIVERPSPNREPASKQEMKDLLDRISKLRSEDLSTVMDAISQGLIRQRDLAEYRSVDFETVVANIAIKPKVTPKTWEFVHDEFVAPHASSLRFPSLLEWVRKRAGITEVERPQGNDTKPTGELQTEARTSSSEVQS